MAFRLVYCLLIVVLLILVHVFFTMYWLLLEKKNLEPSDIYPRKTNTQDGDNQQKFQSFQYLQTPISPLTPNPKTVKFNGVSKSQTPWYFKDGTIRPTNARVSRKDGMRTSRVWPEEQRDGDRVEEQLMFVPPGYKHENAPLKKILLYNDLQRWSVDVGQNEFRSKDCPVDRCTIVVRKSKAPSVDAIVFRDEFSHPGHEKSDKQIWIMSVFEPAYHNTKLKSNHDNAINWTATYRHDSDIVVPYGRWAYYDPSITQANELIKNYAQYKTKKVAMFVTECDTDDRLLYAKELGKYIPVDVYDKCGKFKTIGSDRFLRMLDEDYKFYLAFENSNCADYVTEKFFVDGLQHNVLPIVMGGRREDYERMAPESSYLHVDDFESPERLARYLRLLDNHDYMYNQYFRWKGTGEFIDTRFFCRLCAMLHDDGAPAKHYADLDLWWSGPGVCDPPPALPLPPPPTSSVYEAEAAEEEKTEDVPTEFP